MIEDAGVTGPLWTPTPYWKGYCARIERELARTGLTGLRTNQRLLKGFAWGGVSLPAEPAAAWKRAAWYFLESLPGVRRIVAEYTRLLRAEHRHHNNTRVLHARLAMDVIAEQFPKLRPPAGLANGGADDAFQWRGHEMVPAWVMHLARIADFYARVPPASVRSIMEIGPGLGFSSLAHIALNPHLERIFNVDIVPVLYLSTQFLKSIYGGAVMDYRATRDSGMIGPGATAKPSIFQLAPWQLPRVESPIGFFFNAFSFQEMEKEICRNYADVAARLTAKGVLLHSMTSGHGPRAGGQKEPISLDWLAALFQPAFSKVEQLDGLWPLLFGGDPACTRLLMRSGPASG